MVEFGVCKLPLVPVRALASDRSEQVTQLLFGEAYQLVEWSENGKWVKIKVAHDEYEGWVDHLQINRIQEAHYKFLIESDLKICLDLVTRILIKNSYINILIGSLLPVASQELFNVEADLGFSGSSKSLGKREDYPFLKEVALKYLNAPYLWGGRSPFGIDCSGFTQVVYRIAGYGLKRDASQQKAQGEAVEWNDRAPGNLVYLQGIGSCVPHVGILLDEDRIIHASGKVRIDKLDQTGIFNAELNRYTHGLSRIRRILK